VRSTPIALVACLLLAGCANLPGIGQERVAADPVEEQQPETCPAVEDDRRLDGWRAGPQRMGDRPCVDVPEEVELDFRLPGVNKGDHTAAKASAVPVNGSWVVPGDTGSLHRISSAGTVLWSASTHPSGFGIHGTPAIDDGSAYVGAYDGALYAFDLDSGDLQWRTVLGGSIGSSPVVVGDRVFVSVETREPSGLVSVVNASTGEEVFRDERVTNHPHSSIAVSEDADRYVVGDNDGILYAWNLSTNAFAWSFETDGAMKGPIAVHDGAAFFGSWDDRVYRVDLADGSKTWSFETGANVMGGVGIDPRSGVVFAPSFDDNLYALDAADGALHWRSPLGGSVLSSPTIADGLVLVGSYDEHLYALDATDGSRVWSYQAQGAVTSSPAVAEDRVAFSERADERPGRLYVLEPAS